MNLLFKVKYVFNNYVAGIPDYKDTLPEYPRCGMLILIELNIGSRTVLVAGGQTVTPKVLVLFIDIYSLCLFIDMYLVKHFIIIFVYLYIYISYGYQVLG